MIFQNIRTNLITGFLGVGKTTVVRKLLEQVPQGERWAVLVNEFGEVGIDAAMLDEEGAAIQEVAGGCLCCVASSGFQVGLNRLIRDARPTRIIIEPSGIGHPAQVLQTLTSPPYNGVLDVRATVCLLDARHLSQDRYLEHSTWQDQIHLADVLLASKSDLYEDLDRENLARFLMQMDTPKQVVASIEQGVMNPAWLDIKRSDKRQALFPEAHAFLKQVSLAVEDEDEPQALSPGEWLKLEQLGDERQTCGWRIAANRRFQRETLIELLDGLPEVRVKGVLATDRYWLIYNRAGQEIEIKNTGPRSESRLEIIAEPGQETAWDERDRQLRDCLI